MLPHTPSPGSRSRARTTLSFALRRCSALLFVLVLACSGTTGDGRCADGGLSCVDECVDETTSLLHCGACGNFCEAGEDCVSGTCSCVSGLAACDSGCADVMEDPQNCGACGVACQPGQVCSAGVCAASCGVGLLACGSSCVSTSDSVLHCGSCDAACEAGELCQGGACSCTQGRTQCGGSCTNLAEDPLNCGQCGLVCAVGSTCSGGVCDVLSPGTGGSGTGGQGVGGTPGAGGQGSGGVPGTGGATSGTGGAGSGGQASGGGSGGAGTGGAGSGGSAPGSGGASGCDRAGFYVEGGRLYDANCSEFIMRGINYPYAWYAQDTNQADFDAMAAAGANSVRVVLATGARWTRTDGATLSTVIGWAKAAQLISVLEVHDTTGYAEQSGSVALSNAQAYWTASDIVDALEGQEAYVLVNIGNEPNGNDTTTSWVPSHVTAVQALRNAGLTHTLVVDAPNWGQDWEGTMMNGDGNAIWDADSQKNLIFSVHMYQEFSMASDVTTYMNTFLSEYEAPLIVGEFAADHGSQGDVDEATIMSTAESLGLGYLGWSWSGNGSGLETLDITNGFNASSLTAWGNTLVNGANGLQETSEVCTIFQ